MFFESYHLTEIHTDTTEMTYTMLPGKWSIISSQLAQDSLTSGDTFRQIAEIRELRSLGVM